MTLPPSDSSSGDRKSVAFARLNPYVQKWVWSRKWDALKDVQEAAITAILDRNADIVISAPTAAGKTEAAFLPICSEMIDSPAVDGVGVLYVSPLKALINDQYDRLQDLFAGADIPVHRWHGDVAAAHKENLWGHPRGVLLITPESIEAMFVTRGYSIAKMFHGLRWIVVDELHAYLETARGKQVQSLLHRVESVSGHSVLRIGLSATLGDMSMAAEFLRPGGSERTLVLVSESEGQEVRLQVKGYMALASSAVPEDTDADEKGAPEERIAHEIFRVLRGSNHLVFANSRRAVEIYADRLRQRCEAERVPNEFFPHHGNLSKAIREDVEQRLKDPTLPTTAVCTSTLELGIDVGQVVSIGQIGAPFSVAAIRQRLGRSGRRGDPAILRVHISGSDASSDQLLDGLNVELVQAMAIVELLIKRWCEPPDPGRQHLSTLVHQTLSLIAERGGVKARAAWSHLCETGAFRSVGAGQFAELLRCMGGEDLIVQSGDGDLVLGAKGERVVNHFGFFAVFESPEEYRIVCDGRALGTVSVDQALVDGVHIIFAGRRWCVLSVDRERKVVTVAPAPGGRVPMFELSKGGLVHDRVRQEMRHIYESTAIPAYLDAEAARLLGMARRRYGELGLDRTLLIQDGKNALLFACRGDRIVNTLAVLLSRAGLAALQTGPAITLPGASVGAVREALRDILSGESTQTSQELAARAHNKQYDKYDWVLSEEMLNAEYASRALDVSGALDFIRSSMGERRGDHGITKGLFLSALGCRTQAWLSAKLPLSPSVGEQKRMREGQEVAGIARKRFPGGTFVTKKESESPAQATRRLLGDAAVDVLFEATFEADGLIARADIVLREVGGWRVIEVKSGKATFVSVDSDDDIVASVEFGAKPEYIADLAYTLMVMRRSGVKLNGGALLLLNPDYRLGDPESSLFAEVDCFAEAGLLSCEFETEFGAIVQALQLSSPPPASWKTACKGCAYFEKNCLGQGKRHPITELPRLRAAKMREILETGATEIADVPDHIELGDNHSATSPPGNRVRVCVRSGRVFVSTGLRAALAAIEWPVRYLDFETLATAIPLYEATAPWETVPAQYSLHVRTTAESEPEHIGYIAKDPREDCRRELAERLVGDLGIAGSVVTYSGFEARIISALAARFPDLGERLRHANTRIVDLCELVAAHYYHPEFRGRVSIKVVLPVLVGDLDYSDLEVADGDVASALLSDAARGVLSSEAWKRASKHLSEYCARDTMAMVRVHETLTKLSAHQGHKLV